MYFVMLPSHQSPIVSAYSRDQLEFFSEFLAISYNVSCHSQMNFWRGRSKCFSRYCRSTMERAADILKTPLHIKEGSKEIKMDLVRHWEIVLGPISMVGVLEIPQEDSENYWPVKHCKWTLANNFQAWRVLRTSRPCLWDGAASLTSYTDNICLI